jgi:hypothetical protein
VNNANQPVKSSDSHFASVKYSPLFQFKEACGEQVPFVMFRKQFRPTETFCSGVSADRRILERGRFVRVLFDFELAGEPPALLFRWDSRNHRPTPPAPQARHICRKEN